ncbi:MAG: XRE family transcriptional regulator [Proteobacteria bacterium]|nr:XRE family transcriptional regulator [Pseudomonadota bacterium]MBI3498439.1 XRE family transcriptional regulator [Pseudomonadota bacterium]
MSGRHSFAALRAKMSPRAQAKAAAQAADLRRDMDLAQIRRALKLSQEELGQTLQVGQAAVAKLEKRTDMYLSTIRRFVEAMGGQLEVVARFPGQDVRISNFHELHERDKQDVRPRHGGS